MDFGGSHTVTKLECLRGCLEAFTSTMGGQGYRLKYLDPFAGCGTWSPQRHERLGGFFPQPPTPKFDGSSRIALGFSAFDKFLFADKLQSNVDQLNDLAADYPNARIRIRREEATTFLCRVCDGTDWAKWRGFAFLDPFGLPPQWSAVEALAKTRAIDFLCLLPPGINRLLTLDGKMTAAIRTNLDQFCPSLYDACYRDYTSGLIERKMHRFKIAHPHAVAEHYGAQLRMVFKHVVRRPLPLNTDGPAYCLWGAVADNAGAAERLAAMQKVFSDPDIRYRGKQLFAAAHHW